MIQINNYIKLVFTFFCLFIVSSCTKENHEIYNKTTTLRLNIPMLDVSSRATEEGTDAEDKIHSLRVFILDMDNNQIHNKKYSSDEIQSNSISIDNVPIGFVQLYVIANEESLGKDYGNLTEWQNSVLNVDGTKKILFIDGNSPKKFPLKGSDFSANAPGLPMTWEAKTLEVKAQQPGQSQEVNVELERAVAKINLVVKHGYEKPISITNVSFGPFMGDRLYLFKENNNSEFPEVPSDAVYTPQVYENLNVTLPEKEDTRTLAIYVYPSFAWKSGEPEPYTIGFESSVGKYPAKPILTSAGIPLRSMKRNTVLNIKVFISETNVSFDFKVSGWDDKTIEVPEFE